MSVKRKVIATLASLVILCGFIGFVKRESLRNYRQTLFINAALDGNVTRMKLLLLVGANVDAAVCQAPLCPPPIVAAAFNEDTSATKLLIDHGANINSKMNRGDTALMIAAHQGHLNTVRLLLESGANPSVEVNGETALQRARQRGHWEIVDLLAKSGAAK